MRRKMTDDLRILRAFVKVHPDVEDASSGASVCGERHLYVATRMDSWND